MNPKLPYECVDNVSGQRFWPTIIDYQAEQVYKVHGQVSGEWVPFSNVTFYANGFFTGLDHRNTRLTPLDKAGLPTMVEGKLNIWHIMKTGETGFWPTLQDLLDAGLTLKELRKINGLGLKSIDLIEKLYQSIDNPLPNE